MPPQNNPLDGLSRRRFLAFTGLVPAALLVPSFAGRALGADSTATPARPAAKKYPIGIELYAVRGELVKALPGTLREVAGIGYEVVEFYAPYYNWAIPYAKEVRARMDDLGLRCYSTHNHIESFTPGEGMAKAIELNQILGARHIILSSAGRKMETSEDWKNLSGQLSAAVTQLLPHGLTAGFHNHQTEWTPLDGGQRAMDVLAANTPKEFVLQFDVGTCMEAGADPIAWIKANPGRIRSVHLKDWAPGKKEDEKGYRVLFGEGVSPWAEITAAAEAGGGVEFYLMEQEGSRYPEFETARRCLETWKQLRQKT
jgi:sugar phosphate isomerase/epimerase